MNKASLDSPLPLEQAIEQWVQQHPGQRLLHCLWQGKRLWIKQACDDQAKRLHRIQHLLAAVLNMPHLRTTVSAGGKAALRQEARVLAKLATSGIKVPAVLASGSTWIALSDNGVVLTQLLSDPTVTPRERERLLQRAAVALARLHQQGHWHGRPALRDMTVDDEQVGFLDFEEDPAAVMSVTQCQLRDATLFFHQLVKHQHRVPGGLSVAALAYVRNAPAEVVNGLHKTVKRLKPVVSFVTWARPLLGERIQRKVMFWYTLDAALRLHHPLQDPPRPRWRYLRDLLLIFGIWSLLTP